MNYLSSLKIPGDYAAVATVKSYFHSNIGHKKITYNLSDFSFSKLSSSYSTTACRNTNISLTFSRKKLIENSCRNSKHYHVKKPLWKKLIFGSKKFRSIILLNVITVIYASNIAVIKEVEAFTDPAYFSAVRFAVSTIPFIPFIIRCRKDNETRKYGLELGLWVSLGYLSEAVGLLTSDAGRASFISLFTVIIIPMLESLLGEIVPARTWFGILMSVIGICMLECSGSPPNIGDLFNFLSAIFFGIHTLRTEHISRTTTKDNLLALLGYEVGVVAVLSTIWCLMGSNFDSNEINLTWDLLWDWMVEFPWIPALYTGVFSTGLCLWGEISAMREVSATETAVIYGMEPLWGAGFAWFMLGERWGPAGWVGAALVLGGSLSVQMFGAVKEENNEQVMVSDQKKVVMVRYKDIDDNVMDILKKK